MSLMRTKLLQRSIRQQLVAQLEKNQQMVVATGFTKQLVSQFLQNNILPTTKLIKVDLGGGM